MPTGQTFTDAPLTLDQAKAAGYIDAPLDTDHPWVARFPRAAAAVRAGLDALPGIGGVAGLAVAGPETAGLAAIPAVALGTAAGRGLRDLIAEGLRIDARTSPTGKAARIALDGGEAAVAQAVLPGLFEAIKRPGATVREVVDLLPPKWRPSIPQGIQNAPAQILVRPAWQTWDEYLPKADTPKTPLAQTTATAWRPAPMPPTSGEAAAPTSPVESASGGTAPPSGPPASPAPVESPASSPAGSPRVKGDTLNLAGAQRTPGQMSESWIGNDVAIAAKRAGVTLTDQEFQQAIRSVQAGQVSPAQAVQAIGSGPVPPLTPEHAAVYQQLRVQGLTDRQARQAIAARELQQQLRTPTDATVDAKVKDRNATGRWRKE